MCKSMENRDMKMQVSGAITGMKLMGASDKDIITKIMEQYKVKKSYVLSVLNPKKA